MSTYILLLRGINAGKANRLPMATLKAVLQQLGAQQPSTLSKQPPHIHST